MISELRAEGWKDWHLLMAISNLVINFRLAKNGEDPSDPEVRRRLMRWQPEDPSEEQIDPTMVTAAALRTQLLISAGATADAFGLQLKNTSAQQRFSMCSLRDTLIGMTMPRTMTHSWFPKAGTPMMFVASQAMVHRNLGRSPALPVSFPNSLHIYYWAISLCRPHE